MGGAYEAEKVTEEVVLDGVLALGRAYMWMRKVDDCKACFEKAKEGFLRLLGEDHAKSVDATFQPVCLISTRNCAFYLADMLRGQGWQVDLQKVFEYPFIVEEEDW